MVCVALICSIMSLVEFATCEQKTHLRCMDFPLTTSKKRSVTGSTLSTWGKDVSRELERFWSLSFSRAG